MLPGFLVSAESARDAVQSPVCSIMRNLPLTVAALLAAVHCVAAEPQMPPPGSFGFDWLKPDLAKCTVVPASAIKQFRSCKLEKGAFGLDDPVLVCRRSAKSEYMVFRSKPACLRNFDTMQANSP